MRYLEDFQPGQTFAAGPMDVEAEEIIRFAERYDPQAFHMDPAAARQTFFKGLVASGWMTVGLTMRMLVTSGMDIAGGVIGREVEALGWPRPVRPGDRLRTVSEVIAVTPSRSRPERGMIRLRTDTFNQNDELVQTMTTRIVVPARAGGKIDA